MTKSERGNIFVMIFIAIILIGLLTVAIRGYSGGDQTISKEEMKIQVARVMRTGSELEIAVQQILGNGTSERDILFAHPDAAAEYGLIATTPSAQVFSVNGGRAEYRLASTAMLASGTGAWEFFGTTAIPQVGSDRPELVAVLPNVTAVFCAAINKELGLTGQPNDSVTGTTPDCVMGAAGNRFGAGAGFNAVPNVMDGASFSKKPMTQACVTCGVNYHYYYVLMAR